MVKAVQQDSHTCKDQMNAQLQEAQRHELLNLNGFKISQLLHTFAGRLDCSCH